MGKPNPTTTPFIDVRTGLINRPWLPFVQRILSDTAGTGAAAPGLEGLVQNQLVLMGTNGALRTLGSRGNTTTVLHGNPSGPPTFRAVNLTGSADVSGVLPAVNGGTGFASYLTGDLLYADGDSSLARLPAAPVGNVLLAAGAGVAPAWGKVDLTIHVDGILPVVNGGTGTDDLADLVDDPTAELSFVAQPGVATTFARSDSAPRLAASLELPEGEDFELFSPDDTESTSTRGGITLRSGENDSFSGASLTITGAAGTLSGSVYAEAGGELLLSARGGENTLSLGTDASTNMTLTGAGGWQISLVDPMEVDAPLHMLQGAFVAGVMYPPTDAGAQQTDCALYAGIGAPDNANGADGSFYFRKDGGAGTYVYFKDAGAWTGII